MEVNPSVSESQWERDINLCVSILYRQPFCTCAFPGPNPGESHTYAIGVLVWTAYPLLAAILSWS